MKSLNKYYLISSPCDRQSLITTGVPSLTKFKALYLLTTVTISSYSKVFVIRRERSVSLRWGLARAVIMSGRQILTVLFSLPSSGRLVLFASRLTMDTQLEAMVQYIRSQRIIVDVRVCFFELLRSTKNA